MCQCPVTKWVHILTNFFYMSYTYTCSVPPNGIYMNHYLGNIGLWICCGEIRISNKLVWVQKKVICPMCLFKSKCCRCELVRCLWNIRTVGKNQGVEKKEVILSYHLASRLKSHSAHGNTYATMFAIICNSFIPVD